jgi:hypothetical protein
VSIGTSLAAGVRANVKEININVTISYMHVNGKCADLCKFTQRQEQKSANSHSQALRRGNRRIGALQDDATENQAFRGNR